LAKGQEGQGQGQEEDVGPPQAPREEAPQGGAQEGARGHGAGHQAQGVSAPFGVGGRRQARHQAHHPRRRHPLEEAEEVEGRQGGGPEEEKPQEGVEEKARPIDPPRPHPPRQEGKGKVDQGGPQKPGRDHPLGRRRPHPQVPGQEGQGGGQGALVDRGD
jgi:hypothetical protein